MMAIIRLVAGFDDGFHWTLGEIFSQLFKRILRRDESPVFGGFEVFKSSATFSLERSWSDTRARHLLHSN